MCCLCVIWFVYLHRHGGSGRGSNGYAGYPARTQDKCGQARNVQHNGTIYSLKSQAFAFILSSRCKTAEAEAVHLTVIVCGWPAKLKLVCVRLQTAPCGINKSVIATYLADILWLSAWEQRGNRKNHWLTTSSRKQSDFLLKDHHVSSSRCSNS